MTVIKMIQSSKNRWRIESQSGNILLDDILLASLYDAEEFVKAYASSYTWAYEVIPLGSL